MSITSGNGQSGTVGQELAQSVVVRVTDAGGRAVANIAVTFVVTDGGGSVFAATSTTGADGTATNRWTLGVQTITQSLEARLLSGGSAIVATFAATALASSPVALEEVDGNGQTGSPARPLADPLRVRALDEYANPVPGASVSWAVLEGSGTAPGTSTTNASGVASAEWMVGQIAGTVQRVEARLDAVPNSEGSTVTFTADVVATEVSRLEIQGGNQQSGQVGTVLQQPLTIRALDEFDNPVGNVPVVWSVTAGGGSVTPGTSLTDSNGIAFTLWTMGTVVGETNRVTAQAGPATTEFTAIPGTTLVLFFEDFETDLSQWTGRGGTNNAELVADPLDASNTAVYFTRPVAAGDAFSFEIVVDPSDLFRITFDYLGLPIAGSPPDDHGGFIGIADEIPGNHFWIGGTDPAQALVHLIDDGTWRTYEFEFRISENVFITDGAIRVMIEDGEVTGGVPRDAFFDNIRLERIGN